MLVSATSDSSDPEALSDAVAAKADDIRHVSLSTSTEPPGYFEDESHMAVTIGIKGKIIIIVTAVETPEYVGTKIGITGISGAAHGGEIYKIDNIIFELHTT